MVSTLPPKFSDLPLSPALIQVVKELGFNSPTAIQAQSIPCLVQGKDLIAQSETGSGKTAAFALPILEKLDLRRRQVQALVVCPTRELCAQVAREIRKLARRHAGLQVLVLAGGTLMGPQLGALDKGVHVVVGTPGRLLDHLKRRSLDLGAVKTVVLDEADRMLEMGFQEDMERIFQRTPSDRQTVLFSATFPKTIEKLSRVYQRDPLRITIAQKNQTVALIRQVIYEVEVADRLKALLWVFEQNKLETAIVFCNFKTSVIELARELSRSGLGVGALHGDLEQYARDQIMAKFRNRSLRVLVATDVAARGIDVENLDAVVNFELPQKSDVYVHRIGRTGRAGKKGLAVSFYSSREQGKLEQIEQYSGSTLLRKTIATLDTVELSQLGDRANQVHGQGAMKTLSISGGRKDKVRPGDILGALTGDAGGLNADDIGKIEIHDYFSYVAISANIASIACQRLRDGRIKGRRFRVNLV